MVCEIVDHRLVGTLPGCVWYSYFTFPVMEYRFLLRLI